MTSITSRLAVLFVSGLIIVSVAAGQSAPSSGEAAPASMPASSTAASSPSPAAATAPINEPVEASAAEVAPEEAPAIVPTPLSKPAAIAAAASPAQSTAAEDAPAASIAAPASRPSSMPARNIRFQFAGTPYNDVVRQFCQQAIKKPIIGDLSIEGTLTFFDSEPYSFEEAFDTLNILLSMRGVALSDRGRYVEVVPMDKIQPRFIGSGQGDEGRPSEFITAVLPLKFLDSASAKAAIIRNVSKNGYVGDLPKGKGIVITDRRENIDYVRTLLAALDTTSIVEQQMKSYTLKKASALSIAETIQSLFGPSRARRMVWNAQQNRFLPDPNDTGDFVSAVADSRTNMLFLIGSSDRIEMAAQMIEQLDIDAPTESGEIRIFELKNARADDVANMVRQLQPTGQAGPQPGRGGRGAAPAQNTPARVVANPATNSVVVSAPIDQMAAIEKFILDIDAKMLTVTGAKIIRLQAADAHQLAPIVTAVGTKRDSTGRTVSSLVVSVDARTNSLIVAGAASDIQDAEKLIAELDRKDEKDAREIRVIQLKAGDARAMADSLKRIFAQQDSTARRGGSGDTGTLRVEAEPATNSLIIAAGPADWPVIQDILEKLKASIEPASVLVTRLVPLKHAQANDLADTLRRAYAPQAGAAAQNRGRAGSPASTPPVIIASNERTNSLLITACDSDQQALGELIAMLDVSITDTAGVNPMILIRLKSADAGRLAGTLQAMLPKTKDQEVFIQADPTGSVLLIRGPEAQRKMIEDLVAQLDEETTKVARVMQTIKLKNSSAGSMANMLTQLYQGTAMLSRTQGRRAPSPIDVASEAVIVTAGPDDRTLVIDAPKQKIESIVELARSMDEDPAAIKTEVRTYQLTNGSARELAPSLGRLFNEQQQQRRGGQNASAQPQPRFEADAATNQLMVAATAEQYEIIEELIKKLNSTSTLASQTKTFRLKNARSNDVISVLQTMLNDSARLGRAAIDPSAITRVAAMTEGNTIIVQGLPDKLAMAEQLITTLDNDDADSASTIQIVQLKNSQAKTLADSVNASLGQQNSRGGARTEPEVSVIPEPNSNSLLIRGKTERIAAVLEMIKKLDDQVSAGATQVRIFTLENGEATALATTIEKFFRDITSQNRNKASGETQPSSVSADLRTNSLIVCTTPPNFGVVENLIKSLDKAPDRPARDAQYYFLQNADPMDVATKLDAMFADRRGSDKPVIEPDYYTQSVTVIAKDADIKMIDPVVAKLDEAAKGNNLRIRVIPLAQVKADKMAEVIKRVYGQMTDREIVVSDSSEGKAEPASMPSGAGVYRFEPASDIALDEDGQAASQPAAKTGQENLKVSIAVDRNANALIITGTKQDLETIESLIEQLAASTDKDSEFRIFTIKNADPAAIARTLNDLFNPKPVAQAGQPGQPNQAARGGRGGRAPAANQPAGGDISPAAAAPVQTPPAVITAVADVRTRTLIVRAKPVDFDSIEGIIRQLDQPSQKASEVKVFTLKNTDAVDVAANIRELFMPSASTGTAARGAGRSANTPASPAIPQEVRAEMIRQMIEMRGQGGEGDVAQADLTHAMSISANRGTNSVVVSAPSDVMELIGRVIQELDQTAALAKTPSVRMYPLKQADVATTVANLQQLFSQQARAAANRGGAGGTAAAADVPVIVTGDEAGKLVIVSAPADRHELIAKTIQEIDQAQGGEAAMSVKVYKIEHADATTLAASLNSTLSDSNRPAAAGGARGTRGSPAGSGLLRITGDAGSNSLIVRASQEDHDRIAQLLVSLDSEKTGQGGTYIIALKNGDAATVATMVRDLYAQSTRGQKQVEPMGVTADERANAIILSTSKDNYEKVLEWVNKVEEMKPSRGNLRIITVPTADPTEVDNAIRQLYNMSVPAGRAGSSSAGGARRGGNAPGGTTGGTAGAITGGSGVGSGKVETTVLPQQRTILVNANDQDFEDIMKLVASLEEAAKTSKRDIRIFTLKNATNTRVAPALDNLFRQVAGGAPRTPASPADTVTITALAQTNAIVVAAAKQRMEEIAGLIEQLDKQENSPSLDFRIYPLKNASPTKILPTLRQMTAQIQKARPEETINVEADERTRSIVVSARGNVFEQVSKIIESLDKAPEYEKAEVLVLQLKHADAARMATVLNEMFKPDAAGQVTPEARALQEQVRLLNVRNAKDEKLPELDLTKPIKITADPANPQGSNSLVIASTAENIKALQAVVELMDVVPVTDGVCLRLVHLQNSDAASVITVLKDIFTQGASLAGRRGTSVAGKAEPESTSGKALVNPLNASADLRTNTVILSGSEESVALAEVLIKDMDRNEGKVVTEVRLFKLKNADAAKAVPLLQSVFAETAAVAGTEGVRTQVTRLKTVLDKQQGHQTDLPKSRAALSIQADASTNIVIVAARSDLMPLIADVINTMDIPGAGSLNTVRIFPLENADATRLQTVISSLYTGPNAALIRAEDKPTVAVDARTNALVVAGSDKTFATIEALLKNLDAKTPIDLRDIRLLPLKNAEAAMLATTLQKMMDARVQRLTSLNVKDADALKMIVIADERSNSLIVGGSAEGFQIIKTLAEQLDTTSPALNGLVQVFPLTNGNAGNIATSLANLFNQRYAAAATKDVQRQKPIILSDLRTNSLLVAANEDDTRILKGLLEKLDVKLTDPAVRLEVIPLKFNDCGTVGPTIRTIFASRLRSLTPAGQTSDPASVVDVAVEPLSNALIVSASKENIEEIKALLEKVDIQPPVESGIIKVYQLKYADATNAANLLKGLITQGLYKPSMTAAASNPALAAREKVSIISDFRTNVLIVSASKENMAVIEEMLKHLDTDVSPLMGDMRLFTLKKADATKLAPVLQQFFTQKRAGEMAVNTQLKTVPVVVIADGRTNTLLVAGGKENFAAVEEMVNRLDNDELAALTDFRIFPLKNATAALIQPTLMQLFNQRIVRTGGTKDPITVLADPKTNSLMVGASPDDMKLAESLIAKLDAIQPTGFAVKVFPLNKADATTAAQTIRSLMTTTGTPGAAGTAGAASAAGIGISVDARTNSLIVSAGQADIDRIAELVKQLDQDHMARVTEIRVFTLNNADARELATILTEVLTTRPKSPVPDNPSRQSLLQFITRTKDGQDLISSALQEGVLITPDVRNNSVVVTAPLENMPLLENLIKAMDSTSPKVAEIRVFPLQNADAAQTGVLLTQLFRLQGQAASASAAASKAVTYTLVTTQPAGDSTEAQAGPSATVGNAEQAALSVTVDTRTNSLLIGGTKQYVDLASKIIQELDASPAQERMSQVYRLRNARAGDVQTALRGFLDQENQRLRTALGAANMGSPLRMSEQEVAVVAVPSEGNPANSNTLLISASPRYFQTVQDIIKQLDEPPPQVLIQVLLAEVTLDDGLDLGMDAMYTHQFGDNDVKTGTDFAIEGDIARNNGFSVSVTGGDISFFLRALQSQGRLEVLDRPQILASDNQQAKINVGQRVPFITESRLDSNNNTINTVQYQDVGVILTVTPRANPDGLVKINVNSEISSLSTASVTISPGVNAKIVDTRNAQSTVSVQDGHTAVIGGLITTHDENREDKVPVLGDIPGLGNLFKKTTKTKQRTELLIILTPHVMRTLEKSDARTAEEVQRFKNLMKGSNQDELKRQLFPNGEMPTDWESNTFLKTISATSRPAASQPAGEPISQAGPDSAVEDEPFGFVITDAKSSAQSQPASLE